MILGENINLKVKGKERNIEVPPCCRTSVITADLAFPTALISILFMAQ